MRQKNDGRALLKTTNNADLTVRLQRRIRWVLGAFIVCLVLSGVTAFPLLTEMGWLTHWFGVPDVATPDAYEGLQFWLVTVRNGLRETYDKYPFIAYGTDWLAFAHIAIAIFFIGPMVNPRGQQWILVSGMIACALVPVIALTCGPVRGIPFYWRLIDCSFGVVGFVPLWLCWRWTNQLASLEAHHK